MAGNSRAQQQRHGGQRASARRPHRERAVRRARTTALPQLLEKVQKGKEMTERPVGKGFSIGAGYGIRTRDIQLGKLAVETPKANNDRGFEAPADPTVTPTVTPNPVLDAIRGLIDALPDAEREALLAALRKDG